MSNNIYKPGDVDTMKLQRQDSVGKKIGNFLITELSTSGNVIAKCELCNNITKEYNFYKIKSGHTTSCGCKQKIQNPEQYVGQKFHKLNCISICDYKDKDGAIMAKFRCDCGTIVDRRLNNVLRGKFKSCGCGWKTVISNFKAPIIDMERFNKIHDIWRQMIKRCYQSGDNEDIKKKTPKELWGMLLDKKVHPRYSDYGARGISVCDEWKDVEKFYIWYSTNIRPNESIDRINNDGNYEPSNCKSSSIQYQNINQRLRSNNRTGYKGVIWTGHSYSYNVKQHGVVATKQGFKTPEIALIERNILIIRNKLPHKVQRLKNYKVSIFYNVLTGKHHIGYADGKFNILFLSPTQFNSKYNKEAIEICRIINTGV